jgi:hypothetical protein
MIMERIHFTGFTLLLMTGLVVAGTPVQAGGLHSVSRQGTVSWTSFVQWLNDAAEGLQQLLVPGSLTGQNETPTTRVLDKDGTGSGSTPVGTSATGGVPIPPPPNDGGGCIDPNGHPKPC